ncbi:secretory carrier-associated membrane protein [Anaeramoeba flamelloides]|uniref:Secretory carrier-associated membrane protein n=1 Tax=Anaeramoeba flamelloides TaxID=1746091 RepID=A0ABQ8XDY6_9EUKA|nr:secretory carrier-associated membrane protein [Anaeramoeba flamelloides]
MINPFAEGSSSNSEDDSVTKVSENTNFQSYTNEPIQNENDKKKKPDPIDEGYKPPEYLQEENPLASNNTVEERELMLERREQELLRREQELNQKSRASGIDLDRPPNWPKCRPMYHHDISKDIPQVCRPFMRFILFFSTFSIWFLFSIFMVIGIKGTGSAGIINVIDIFGSNKTVGFFMLANIILWALEIVLIVIIFKQVNSFYQSSSLTTEQAKQELGTEVGKQLASGMI